MGQPVTYLGRGDGLREILMQLRQLVKDPKHWRARANEMRSVAAQATDQKVKATTSGAADAFENLAQLCELNEAVAGQQIRASP